MYVLFMILSIIRRMIFSGNYTPRWPCLRLSFKCRSFLLRHWRQSRERAYARLGAQRHIRFVLDCSPKKRGEESAPRQYGHCDAYNRRSVRRGVRFFIC